MVFFILTIASLSYHLLLNRTRKGSDPAPEYDEEGPTGTWQNAGVIYDKKFLAKMDTTSNKEPASFTPYIEDYMLHVQRPKLKPFPTV